MPSVLDINDASLGLWQGDSLSLASPGYALLEGKEYRFGLAAREKARLLPRQINHRYWAQLDTEPMVPAFGPSRHSADLVHAHLLSIHEGGGRPDELIVAAPGSLQHNQLALLLGIAEQCPFNVAGLVDRAVAACAGHPVADYNWHVELQLNQALLTGMRFENGQLIRDNLVPIPGSGWLALQDALARAISDAFIRQTRFDPRRSASNEQSLYDALPGILERLETASETNIDLDGRQARVERAALVAQCESHYERILRTVTSGDAAVFLGNTLQGLPELGQRLPDAVRCAAADAISGIEQHLTAIQADPSGLRFITSLPAASRASSAPAPVAQPIPAPEPAPEPIPEPVEKIPPSRCQIEFDGGSVRIAAQDGPLPSINGTPLAGTAVLNDGDLLELPDGTTWKLTSVRRDGT